MVVDLQSFKDDTNYHDLEEGEENQIQRWLDVAEQKILDYTNGIWDNKNGSSLIADNVQINMVRRKFDNQRGIISASVDGVSESYDSRAGDGLRLTEEDRKDLGKILPIRTRFNSIRINKNYGHVW